MYDAFASLYDNLMHDVDYDAWAGYLISLIDANYATDIKKQLIDCACGTGEITIRLAKHGCSLIGVDLSEQMLQIAQQKSFHQGLRIPYVCQNMCNLACHNPADVIVCACDGVNYLTSIEDVTLFFNAAYAALKPKGLLLFDVSSAYKLENILGEHTYGEDLPDCTYLWENIFDPNSRLLEMQLHFFLPKKDGAYTRFDERHIQRAHTDAELKQALENAGFDAIRSFECFTKQPATTTSERIQWIARRR